MLRRSLLYIPASNQKMLNKAKILTPDTIALDLEDGVAESAKQLARENLLSNFTKIQKVAQTPELGIRINSVSSINGNFSEDVEMLNSLEKLPTCVLVPKVDDIDESKLVIENLHKVYQRRGPNQKPVNLITFVETARALINLKEIFEEIRQKTSQKFKLVNHNGCVFGSDDYCADMNIERTDLGLLYARQKIATTCKVYGLDAIDMVNIDFKNNEGMIRQCVEGRSFGFSGKQLIHPNQIEDCNRLFSPNEKQVEWARELIVEFEKFSDAGQGAFTFRGQMIDKPLLRIAENIIKVADR